MKLSSKIDSLIRNLPIQILNNRLNILLMHAIEIAAGLQSFHVQPGASWHAFIQDDGCHRPKSNSQNYDSQEEGASLPVHESSFSQKVRDEPDELRQLKLYPNPNTGIFVITVSDDMLGNTVHIIDLFGKPIHSMTMNYNMSELTEINLPHGVYFVTCTKNGNDVQATVKMVVL